MPEVVVIGAGASGLAVAQQLSKKQGFHITVVDALDRIGGRVKSADLKSDAAVQTQQKVDLGASWLHESRVNPLFKLALEKKWKLKYTDVNIVIANENGPITQKSGAFPIADDMQAQIEDFVMSEKPRVTDNVPFRDFAEQKIAEMPLVTEEQKRLALDLCHEIEHFIAMPWDQIPVADGIHSSAHGRDAFILGLGYQQVLDWLYESIDHTRTDIHLNEEVLRIESCEPTADSNTKNSTIKNKSEGFVVTTSRTQCKADFVVCTIPLGALKRTHSALFGNLDLPELGGIVETIEKTNMGALGKVVVEFPYIWWDNERDMTLVLHEKEGRTESVTLVNPFKGIPALVVLTTPPLTQRVEADPENAVRHIEWAFAHAGGEASSKPIPAPTNVIVTDWTQNKYFMGSYSARSVGQSYDELVEAFIDGAGGLRFAGEHTILEGNGCVHGAYNSGLREAERILELASL